MLRSYCRIFPSPEGYRIQAIKSAFSIFPLNTLVFSAFSLISSTTRFRPYCGQLNIFLGAHSHRDCPARSESASQTIMFAPWAPEEMFFASFWAISKASSHSLRHSGTSCLRSLKMSTPLSIAFPTPYWPTRSEPAERAFLPFRKCPSFYRS